MALLFSSAVHSGLRAMSHRRDTRSSTRARRPRRWRHSAGSGRCRRRTEHAMGGARESRQHRNSSRRCRARRHRQSSRSWRARAHTASRRLASWCRGGLRSWRARAASSGGADARAHAASCVNITVPEVGDSCPGASRHRGHPRAVVRRSREPVCRGLAPRPAAAGCILAHGADGRSSAHVRRSECGNQDWLTGSAAWRRKRAALCRDAPP